MDLKRTIIYIDGFNLYHRSLKNTPYKWVDYKALFSKILPKDCEITAIKYFTANVSGLGDISRPQRQATYIRALKAHISEISIYYGKFLSHPATMPLANRNYPKRETDIYYRDGEGGLIFKRVVKVEEKGSDVNLSVHILNDAWLDKYDSAVLVSNDSDIAGALSLIKDHHPTKKRCWIIPFDAEPLRARLERRGVNKERGLRPSQELRKKADHIWKIREGSLANSQLPDIILGSNISKPVSWNGGLIPKYLFEMKNLDSGAIFPVLVERGYVSEDLKVNKDFSGIDKDFKDRFPTYTKGQFDEIQSILYKTIM